MVALEEPLLSDLADRVVLVVLEFLIHLIVEEEAEPEVIPGTEEEVEIKALQQIEPTEQVGVEQVAIKIMGAVV
jgi:hypothetical protein